MGGFDLLIDGLASLGRGLGAGTVPLAARLALAAILGVAGVYKIRHPLVAAAAAVNFRVIRRPVKAAGRLLGQAEAGVAVALVLPVAPIALAGSVAAAGLALGYAAITARALRAGRTFPCNCLPGLVGDMSMATLIRALAMVLAAVVGALGPATGALGSVPPAAGLAVAAIGIPLAAYGATSAWRAYRRLIAETDWTWVLAARAGQIYVPESAREG